MTLRLRTFGAVYLEREGSPLGGAHSQRRRLALLAYLAASHGAAITRDKLIALLWPESDAASARHSLSQLLYSLRHDLGTDAIAITSETVRLDPAIVASDVHSFSELLRSDQLAGAVEMYRGSFLDGFHVDDAPELGRWIDDRRTQYAGEYGRALERLAAEAAKQKDVHREVEWWRRRVALDPTHGRATRHLMQSLAAVGDREGALRVARVYEALVRGELEIEPDDGVLRLAEQLRASPVRDVPNAAAPPRAQADGATFTAVAPTSQTPKTPLRTDTTEAFATKPKARPYAMVAALAAAAAITITVLALRRNDGGEMARSDGDVRGATVVLGDLDGPDSILSLAVREALRAELINSRGVILTSDMGLRELATLMRLPRDIALQQQQLLALSVRAGAHVAIAGSVLPVGNGAQIVVELLEPASGRTLRTFSERPVDPAGILESVAQTARSIAALVSRTAADTTVRPLPAVTTSSLPALKSYALARQLATSGKRRESVAPAERAVTHDSTFALAHYLLGDVLWFIDEQTHAEAHLTKAYQLMATVPPREQLVIRARYEQLVLDRPDSALAYWDLLHDASPGDVLAYEGRAWALRALGRHEEAAGSADTAMRLDPAAVMPNTNNVMYSLLGVGDTLGALAVAERVAQRNPEALLEARFYTAIFRGDAVTAQRLADSTPSIPNRYWRQHKALLARGDVAGARVPLDSILKYDQMAFVPNTLLDQGLMAFVLAGERDIAIRYARQVLDWIRSRDLSPPATGRLAERIAHLAALTGDLATIRATTDLLRQRDAGRSLRTYVFALRTLGAANAYARGQFAEAARQAEAARHGVYFSRSLATIVQLEAQARRAAGELAAADSLDRLVATHQIVDGNFDTWVILKAAGALRARGRPQVAAGR